MTQNISSYEIPIINFIEEKWAYIYDNYSDEEEIFLPVFVAWAMFFTTYWTYGIFLLVLEKSQSLKFEIRKHQPGRPMRFEKTNYGPSFLTLFKNVMFNWIFVILPTLYVMQVIGRKYGLGIYVERELPDWRYVLFHLLIAPLITDITFYHSHYMLHLPWFYKRVHKVHHEFKAPYGLCCIYAHWFEVLVGNTMALMGVAFVLNLHCLEWWFAGVMGWIGTSNGHSGLHLPRILAGKTKLRHLENEDGVKGYRNFHDYHHQFFHGNYGQDVLMDWLYGTDKAWRKHCEDKSNKIKQKNN